jgi:Response regulators consisting of a CheY-like receiver domain and a winged-helix DNA-binding domain
MVRTILVVVQDNALREAIVSLLHNEGYRVRAFSLDATDYMSERIIRVAKEEHPALVILDSAQSHPAILPLCRRLRACEEIDAVPILIFVADDREISQLLHTPLAINDFVQRPPRYEELLACVHTLLRSGKRRSCRSAVPRRRVSWTSMYSEDKIVAAGNLQIDIEHATVVQNGLAIELRSPLLLDLLLYLIAHRGLTVSRDRLLQAVWGYEQGRNSRTVDVHMRWLRESLEEDPAHPYLLQTIRGVGYRFNG